MIRSGGVLVFVAITLVSNAAPSVEACGDKFLLVGRSAATVGGNVRKLSA